MRSYPSHRSIEMYGVAAAAAGLPIRMISYTEHERPRGPRGRWKNLVDPWYAARAARLGDDRLRTYVLREFLTLPLLLAVPAYRSLRQRTWLVSVHNLQRARRRAADRFALSALVRCGFRLILPESSAGYELLELRDSAASVAVLPLGVTEAQAAAPRGPKERGLVALIGRARGEKRLHEELERVAAAVREGTGERRLVVGTDDSSLLEAAKSRGLEAVGTTSEAEFRRLLARSEVVVLTYARQDYELRTSGVVLDAAAAHAAVVAPDFPVLRDQLREPVTIGATYGADDGLGAAIARAAEIAHDSAGFDAYLAARSGAALAARLAALARPQGAKGTRP